MTSDSTTRMLLTKLSDLLLDEPEYPDPEVHTGAAYNEIAEVHYAWHSKVQAFRLILGIRLVNEALDDIEAWQESIGDRIRRTRVRRRMKQSQLAKAIELSGSYLSHIEAGRRPTSPELLARIAEALGVTVQELSDG